MKLYRFNDRGLEAVQDWHATASGSSSLSALRTLAARNDLIEFVGEASDNLIPMTAPGSRFDAAAILFTNLEPLVAGDVVSPATDDGMWTWLAAEWRDHLIKPNGQIGAIERWVSALGNSRRFYRHLLAGPYLIYAAHADGPERTKFLLANPLHTPGELAGQVGASQRLLQNPAALNYAMEIYWDNDKQRVRSKVRGKGAGSARRLATVLNQFERTYSLDDVPQGGIATLVPAEFEPDPISGFDEPEDSHHEDQATGAEPTASRVRRVRRLRRRD